MRRFFIWLKLIVISSKQMVITIKCFVQSHDAIKKLLVGAQKNKEKNWNIKLKKQQITKKDRKARMKTQRHYQTDRKQLTKLPV